MSGSSVPAFHLLGPRESERMNPFWIATHDPHGADDSWNVYLTRPQRSSGLPTTGHKVLFYETGKVGPDGQKGRQALVCAGKVIDGLRDRVPPKGKFQYEIPCSEPERATQAVSCAEMLSLLGLPPKTPLFTWQGLKNISESQYARLREMMNVSQAE